jgi:hypothetical protein
MEWQRNRIKTKRSAVQAALALHDSPPAAAPLVLASHSVVPQAVPAVRALKVQTSTS